MDHISEIVGAVAPIIALVWAIYAFYAARKADRDDELRRERQAVYRKYLEAINGLQRPHLTLADNGIEALAVLSPHHEMVALIAPDAVARASLKYVNSHIGDHLYSSGRPIPEIAKSNRPPTKQEFFATVEALEPIRTARGDLLLAMRADLLQGTKVDPSLTIVEELHP